jgi:hypothetical protein
MALATLTSLIALPTFGGSSLTADACIACPNNPSLCYPVCEPCPTATITGDSYSLQSGTPISGVTVDRQGWLNLSWSGGDTDTPYFSWWITSGNDLPIPAIKQSSGSASINLNSLEAGTTYNYEMTVESTGSDCYASYANHEGSFSTLSAPGNEFVGWVSQLVSNSYEIDQIGQTMSGASIWPTAECDVGYEVGSGTSQAVDYKDEAFALPGTSTSSSGGYGLTLPDTYTTTLYYWFGGTKGYQVSETETITLSSGGNCVTAIDGSTLSTLSNPHVFLTADVSGYWNASLYVSSTLSASNDYQQFGLQQNGYGVFPDGVAYIHRSTFPANLDVSCSITEYTGETQEVASSYNLFGYSTGSEATGSVGDGVTASNSVLVNPNIAIDYHTSGTLNETPGTFTVEQVLPYGQGYDVSTDTASFADPDPSIPPIVNNSTSSTVEHTVGPASSQWDNASNGGYFASSSGFNLQFEGEVSPTGWDGLGFSASLAGLTSTTSAGSDTSHEISCEVTDSSPTYAYQYVVTEDGSQATDNPNQIINIHLWYLDECLPGSEGCP